MKSISWYSQKNLFSRMASSAGGLMKRGLNAPALRQIVIIVPSNLVSVKLPPSL